MKTKIGINGFGRIGRNILKIISQNHNEKLEVVAINDLTDTKTLAHLLKYDSLFGKFKGPIKALENSIVVNGNEIKVFRERNPENIDWKSLNAEIVIESTGIFTKKEQAQVHITKSGAKKVLISAPAKNDDVTIVLGVNENEYNPQEHNIISNASCTTNCLATVVKVLDDNYKIKNGFMTTVHSYTNDQNILDLPHKDLRRARAAALSIIPTKTGAAKSIGRVIPNLNKKLDGFAFRVPTATVSVLDLTLNIEKKTSKDDINNLFIDVSNGYMKGILDYTDEELVSIDFKENPASAVIDLLSTNVIDNTIKVLAWYDNEWGYSNRCVDLAVFIAEKGL
jgi:glyceraldehyde 3-phosphate dehydrogenase